MPSLPKLDYDSAELRRRVFDDPGGVVRRWITGPSGLDGWRVDVANMTGRYKEQDHNREVARLMRAAMKDVRPDALLVGEHVHDHSGDALGDGWHGVMNYAGFTRPVWTWLRDKDFAPNFLGSPLMVPRLGGRSVLETMREFSAIVPGGPSSTASPWSARTTPPGSAAWWGRTAGWSTSLPGCS